MFRRFRIPGIVVIALVVWAFVDIQPGQAGAGTIELAQSSKLMQCMEKCMRHEGADTAATKTTAKATCKSRCATIPTKGAKKKNCMGIYKQCKKNCKKNKTCRKACKKALNTCSTKKR